MASFANLLKGDVFLVMWYGEMLEKEAPDAIAFSEADAQALIAYSPGRKQSYGIERCSLRLLLQSPAWAPFRFKLLRRIATANLAPLMLRDEAERQRRAL